MWEVSRSAKSSPPDKPLGENLLLPGNCVRIFGLQKAPEYNDLEAVILEVNSSRLMLVCGQGWVNVQALKMLQCCSAG